jgi:transposase
MATEGRTFEQWLDGARIPAERLDGHQLAVLKAAYCFLMQSNFDYSSSRIVGHFLLHSGLELQVAEVARLVGISTRSAFRHRSLSATEVVQQIQNRLSGRPYGKLLPRHLGSIAEFLFTHPQATRQELLEFIGRTWGFRVSRVALWEFLKKYGLDRASLDEARQATSDEENQTLAIQSLDPPSEGGLVPMVAEDFFLLTPSMPGLSCCGPKSSPGSAPPRVASPMNTARSNEAS